MKHVPLSWHHYSDGITKATVYTLVADGERWSPAVHMDGHGIQVYGERKPEFRGSKRLLTFYTPVIRCGPYGEEEHSGDTTRDLKAAKAWAIATGVRVGLIQPADERATEAECRSMELAASDDLFSGETL